MSTLQGDEPDLTLGDSGEHVVQLQDRLRGLGLLDKYPDGTFDDATQTAVRQMQGMVQVTSDGTVGHDTWEALDSYMLQQGLIYNAYAGAGRQHWDLEAAPAETSAATPAEATAPEQGFVSDDKQWRWDGTAWQPNEEAAVEPAVIPKLEHVHPAIQEDARFASFHEFLNERGG